ncbi:hypothetical protein [Mucilaginibacter agri]|uniref:MalT-like TPR region domain-containing protein n=1 Tax=Mucilaginibacter agri TaxID=2695265 RepID=A0A965ZEI7_9SPHI|nr:hypothetical protein [Mucilaginibacter agri]NCD69260.1 hypothetical protein [Mucilaginibacter agri]
MRLTLLVLLCAISMSASAQWLSFKKHERSPLLPQVQDHSISRFAKADFNKAKRIKFKTVPASAYDMELAENYVMKTAQHNMRFRVYDLASYNFSDLAQLYVQQNRFSEAKWYFLQSNFLSRQQNNDKLTINNLMHLAGVKSDIGDFILAQQDLIEARDMAASHGWLIDLISVEKKLKSIQNSRIQTSKAELRYASNAMVAQNSVD